VKTDIAKKGDVAVLYDNEVSFVGVGDKSFKQVREAFDISEGVLSEVDAIMLANKSRVELVLRADVWTKKDPQKEIGKFLGKKKFEAFASIFKNKVRPFTVRVATEDKEIIKNPNWFDIRIEPLIRNPRYYRIDLVYRNEDQSKTLEIADNIENTVVQAIKIVESD
jgi:hypothetical protein